MKTLSERIAARAAGKKTTFSRKEQNLAVFLALRPEIAQALSDGWPVKRIWETLQEEGKVTFCYSAFWKYINRLIRTPADRITEQPAKPPGGAEQNSQPGKGAQKAKATPVAPKSKETPEIGGFTFNPSPKKEDLI